MKEKIYTIPINDVFSMDTECPLCEFLKKEEANRIEFTLGASMMEPDARIETNKKGFCNHHTEMLFEFGNKLSHALVLETRLNYIADELKNIAQDIKKQAPKKIAFGKSKLKETVANKSDDFLNSIESCIICERLKKVMNDFTENLFYLYKNNDDFKKKFFSSKGFCLTHFEMLLNKSTLNLSDEEEYEFANKLITLESENIERLKEDVNWFTKKFDYRYKDEDWKNSRDAVKRGCEKTAMYINIKE